MSRMMTRRGRSCADEVDDVVVPVALENLGEVFILQGQCQKEHDCGVSLSWLSAIEQNA